MDSLGIMKSNVLCPVSSEDPLWLATEDDLLDPLNIRLSSLALSSSTLSLIELAKIIVEDSLLLVSLTSVVSAFHEFLHKPLNYRVYLCIIETLDLLRSQHLRTFHLL
jgi:hypothetical protein